LQLGAPTLTIDGQSIPYRLRRSARARRLRITVCPRGVEVVAPLRLRDAEIAAFVEHHRAWIDAKLDALQRVLAAHPGSEGLRDGSSILYRGRPVRLRVSAGAGGTPQVRKAGGIDVSVPAAVAGTAREVVVERALMHWLAAQACADANVYLERHGPRHGLMPAAVKVKAQKRLWGSCTAQGVINLNWRLILAPPDVFEYVVVHELCHLREAHHQAPFWRLVAQVMPHFQGPRSWLKANGHLLTLRNGAAD
jgi:predicted metal-dependent hydrolase